MRPLILYCSRTGNTEKAVQAMAAAMDAEVLPADQATAEVLQGRSLVGLASGIYWVRHDKSIFKAAEMLDPGSAVFLVTTCGFPPAFMQKVYCFLLIRKLRRLGLRLTGQWYCPGHDRSADPLFSKLALNKGRPNAADLQNAAGFAKKVLNENSN